MKGIVTIIIAVVLGWFALNYIAERTVEITLNQLEDDARTEWVKAAKEISDTITIADDTIKVRGDYELR